MAFIRDLHGFGGRDVLGYAAQTKGRVPELRRKNLGLAFKGELERLEKEGRRSTTFEEGVGGVQQYRYMAGERIR